MANKKENASISPVALQLAGPAPNRFAKLRTFAARPYLDEVAIITSGNRIHSIPDFGRAIKDDRLDSLLLGFIRPLSIVLSLAETRHL